MSAAVRRSLWLQNCDSLTACKAGCPGSSLQKRSRSRSRITLSALLQDFPYAASVWKEALRLHPPGAVNAREMQRDIVLGDHHLPEGTTVHVSL